MSYNDSYYPDLPPPAPPDPGNLTQDIPMTEDNIPCIIHENDPMLQVEDISYWIREVISTTIGVFGILGNILAIVVLSQKSMLNTFNKGPSISDVSTEVGRAWTCDVCTGGRGFHQGKGGFVYLVLTAKQTSHEHAPKLCG